MEFVVYSRGQGCGYVCESGDEIISIVNPVSVSLNNKVIKPGDLTDIDGYLTRTIKYLGINNTDNSEMIFENGKSDSLFGSFYYYQSIFRIAENRIFEIFAWGSGRDHIFKNGEWK